MTTPTLVQPAMAGLTGKPLEAMKVPGWGDDTLPGFVAWADDRGLRPEVQVSPNEHVIELHPSAAGPVRANLGWWVVIHHDPAGLPYVELVVPDAFDYMYRPARPLEVRAYADAAGEHRWRVVHSSNGETMASGEGYTDRRDRDHAIDLLWPDLQVVVVAK